MQALISCTHCHKQLRIPEAVLGKPVKCPLCNSTFAAPATSQQQPEAPTVPLDPVDKPTAPVKPPVRKDSQVDRAAGIASKPGVKPKASSRLDNGVEDVVTIDPIDEPIRPAKSKPKEKSGSTPWYLLLLSALPLGIIVVLVLGGWLAGMGGLKSVFIGFGLGVGVAGVCVLLNMIGGLHVVLRALGTLFLTFVGYVAAIAIVVIALINRVPVVDPNPNDFFPIDVNNVVVKDEPKIVVVQPTDWRPHVSELGRFAVLMPGAVQTNQIRPPGEFGEHREFFHEFQDQAVVFRVMFDDNLRTQFKDLEGNAEMALRIQRERLAGPGGRELALKDVRSDKYGGKEFEIALPDDGHLVAQQFLAAGRYYKVSIMSKPKTRLAADDALRFFESFKIIPGKDVVIKPPDQPAEPGPGPEPRPRNGAEPVPATKIAGLIGYWAFDEGRGRQAEDASDRHTNAELQGAKWTTGVRGKGLYFDGSAWLDYSSSPSYNFRALAPFTLCGWVQTSQPNGTIISQRNEKDGGAVIHVSIEDGRLCAMVRQDGRDFGPHAAVRGALVNDGQWHHFALTRNKGDTIELFLDGLSQGKGSGALAEGTITTNLRALGSERFWVKTNFNPPEHRFLIGWADELCLFDRQLDGKDIRLLAGNPEVVVDPPVKPPDPVKPSPGRPIILRETASSGVGINSFVHALAFAPDGKTLFVGGDNGKARYWTLTPLREVNAIDLHKGSIVSLSVSKDGRYLATGAIDGQAKVVEIKEQRTAVTLTSTARGFIHVAISADGSQLVTASSAAHLWDVGRGEVKHALKTPKKLHDAVAFAPDGKMVATGSTDKSIQLFDAATGQEKEVLRGHDGPIMSLAFSSDGRLLASASSDRTVKVWDVATGQERLTLRGHNDPLSSVAWSPDGRFLVSGAGAIRFNPGDAGEVKLWSATTGAHLADLTGHNRGVSSVAFAPNGRTVASASRDNTIKLWDVSKVIQSQR